MTVGRRQALATRRAEMGYTQESLAHKLGVAETTVRRWELGSREPRLSIWNDLAEALDLSLDALRAALLHREQAFSVSHVARQQHPVRLSLRTDGQFDEVLSHLRDQWHVLVRVDNLLGPRYALNAVKDQLAVVEDLLPVAGTRYDEVVALAAKYAESAAWLYEDAGQMPSAVQWVQRAMEWAIEASDQLLLAWTIFRRSQHATAAGDAQRTLSLTRAAMRQASQIPNPMRAAIVQQEAQGHALTGDERTANRRLDDAHRWAALDNAGDARGGHGSFCTETYIELQRANCWTVLGKPQRAIQTYETVLPSLPAVYRRDHGMACSRFAMAYLRAGEPEAAALIGQEALVVARSAGSVRTENEVRRLVDDLTPHKNNDHVNRFLAELSLTS